jgi:hypothetical protein
MRIIAALACIMMLASCGGREELPQARTSVGLAMDGSHNVQLTGAVNEIGHTTEITRSVAPEGWSTAPVPLSKPYGFAIATRNGKIMIYDDRDSLKQTISIGDSIVIDQLLTRNNEIYVIGLNGTIYKLNAGGKVLWQNTTSRMVTANVVLTNDKLYAACDNALYTFDPKTGAPGSVLPFALEIHSLAYSQPKESLLIATTRNQAGAEDSLFVMGKGEQIAQRYGFPETRFTSNIALVGDDQDQLAFGFLGGMTGPQRTSAVTLLKGIFDGKLEKVWTQSVPYVIGNIAANDEDVFTSGIREQGELTSGLDAFRIDDTIHTWSRRFSEPLVAPFGVSNGNVYLHLSFRSDAVVETRGIFYTLNARTGKTLREQSIPGAEDGFLPHIPMPDERGRFLLADGGKLVVYLLDRSSFERVFK